MDTLGASGMTLFTFYGTVGSVLVCPVYLVAIAFLRIYPRRPLPVPFISAGHSSGA